MKFNLPKQALMSVEGLPFKKVSQDTPREIPLTSFSILFARYKGNLETTVQGARALENLLKFFREKERRQD